MSEVIQAQLVRAYFRRTGRERQALAVEIINTLGRALGNDQEPREISTAEMMRRIGAD